MSNPSFIFFGTGALAESVLASLYKAGLVPKYVVTKPDAPSGRHMTLTSPHIKTWCDLKDIPVLQPESLKEVHGESPLLDTSFDVFIVASYGKLIPEKILATPRKGILNVHPSLLPLYRGASPIESTLLDGSITTGVSIIKLDNEMDHGPILVQTAFMMDATATAGTLEVSCGQIGGELLLQVLPSYLDDVLIPKEQDHSKATYCTKIEKALGEITLETKAYEVIRKYRALTPWPGIYFFIEHKGVKMRVKVTNVDIQKEIQLDKGKSS
jgi:methionyl-tRNA formyltransferase